MSLSAPSSATGKLELAAQEQEILRLLILEGDLPDGSFCSSTRFELGGDCLQGSQQPCAILRRQHSDPAHEQREQRQHGDLGGEGLGGGDADLGPGMQVDAAIGFARDGAADDVADAQHLVAAPLALAQPRQRVERFAGLGDDHQQGVLVEGRVAVAEFAGVFHLDGHVREFFDEIFPDQPGMPAGAARSNDDAIHGPQLRNAHVEPAELCHCAVVIDASAQGVAHGLRLLKNFLEHEVRIASLSPRLRARNPAG